PAGQREERIRQLSHEGLALMQVDLSRWCGIRSMGLLRPRVLHRLTDDSVCRALPLEWSVSRVSQESLARRLEAEPRETKGDMMAENTDVVVIGGGYAGVMAANRLTRRHNVTVTLINPRPTFVERIRLHQLVGGSNAALVEYREVLAEGVRLVVDTAKGVNPPRRSVLVASGGTVGYDYLVYGVGSRTADLRVPGAAEFAHPIAILEAAER